MHGPLWSPAHHKDRRRASRESMAWTLAFGQPEDRTPTHWLRGDARGRDGGVRQEPAAGVKGVDRPAGGSIQNNSGLPQGPATGSVVG
jgi:hypothetical protein